MMTESGKSESFSIRVFFQFNYELELEMGTAGVTWGFPVSSW